MTEFRLARDFLLAHRRDYDAAHAGFRWPQDDNFNWALDWFDSELANDPASASRCALWIVDRPGGNETRLSFADLRDSSNRIANYLSRLGLARGDALLMLLGNVAPLWQTMLAAMKLGLVIIPATPLLTADEVSDRLRRGGARAILAGPDLIERCAALCGPGILRLTTAAAAPPGWHSLDGAADHSAAFRPDRPTRGDDPLLFYFTSGTTSKPKLVRHTHRSYPVGALSTLYWLGLQPGDVHVNVSAPGWAKHAWSCFFAPWSAGATVLVINVTPFDAPTLLRELVRCRADSLCAPPTVWRLLIQEDLTAYPVALRELCAAGEPLNPEVIGRVEAAWGLVIRDGYGQTESTAQVGNSPGQRLKPGAMGRPLPGYTVALQDAEGHAATEGELCLRLGELRPAGLMAGYQTDAGGISGVDGAVYRSGDVAMIDNDGYLTFVGRSDDVFKSADYRISPFELESVLIEHAAVAEAAVVPVIDAIRLAIPKAYLALVRGAVPDRATALSIFRHVGQHLAPFKRIRRLEFVSSLPKTVSGKIRRVQLRRLEAEGRPDDPLHGVEFREEDFPELGRGKP